MYLPRAKKTIRQEPSSGNPGSFQATVTRPNLRDHLFPSNLTNTGPNIRMRVMVQGITAISDSCLTLSCLKYHIHCNKWRGSKLSFSCFVNLKCIIHHYVKLKNGKLHESSHKRQLKPFCSKSVVLLLTILLLFIIFHHLC